MYKDIVKGDPFVSLPDDRTPYIMILITIPSMPPSGIWPED